MKVVHTRMKVVRTRAIYAAMLLSAPAALVIVGFLADRPHPMANAAMILHQEPPHPSVLQAVSAVADLNSGPLATTGVSGEAVAQLFAIAGSASTEIAVLASAREEHSLAFAADAEIRTAIRSGGLTPEHAAALDAAETRLTAAKVALQAAEGDIRDIAVAALIDRVGTENAALAQRAASNRSRRVPDAWKVQDLTESAWQRLESGWFKAQRGLPDSAFTQAERDALAAAQSNPTVILAQQRLYANLAGVEAAWAQFIAEQIDEQDPM
jgi:hypothetical protein